jgi:hypothetical protein
MDPIEPPKRPRGDFVSPRVVAKRVEEIQALVTDGAPTREIRAFVESQTEWGKEASDATLRRYIAKAHAVDAKAAEEGATFYTFQAIARLQRNYWRASQRDDLAECRQTQEALIKLLGLAKPEHRIITIEDIDADIERLEGILRERHPEDPGSD